MIRLIQLSFILICLNMSQVFGADSLSYSGRLVNSNGSPVTGPVKLKFDLAYTNDLNNILCTHQIPSSDLINGVFHAKLAFTCPTTTLAKVLENIPLNNSIAIRVTDETSTTPKVYSYQALHSTPLSIMSEFAKQLVSMGASNGQLLAWNGTEWEPTDPVASTGGTVTKVIAGEGLDGGEIETVGTISIANGGVDSSKLNQMGAVVGQVLKWTAGGWAPGADLDTDTGITAESDPLIRKFARTDITGIIPPTCTDDQALQYILATDSFICNDIVISSTEVDRVRDAAVADAINDAETAIAPSQNAVFDALTGKQNTITSSSDITLKYLKLMTDGAFWVGLKAPISTAGNVLFTLPGADGTTGQILKTDGSGNLGWVDAANGTLTEITTSAPLSGSGTSGSVALSISYDNSTIGLNGSNALVVKNAGISNAHIAALAGIDWSKINKTGAVASDVGAVPTARAISAGTGLLGGGDLSANRTLSVDVGTTAGKIVQVDGAGKLPVIDGSQLTNLIWSQISKAGSTNLIAGVGLSGGGDLSADRTFDIDVGTTAGKIVQLDGTGKLPAVDGSQLTNLGTNLGKWSNATGGIHFSTGNVGVGTTVPAYPLHVAGSIGATGIALNSGDFDFFRGDGYAQPGVPMVRIRRSSSNATMSVVNVSSINNPAISIPGTDFSNPDNITLFANGNAFFKGNLGIGTNTPATALDITNDNVSDTNDDFRISTYSDSNSPAFFLRKSRGTLALPTAVLGNDALGTMRFFGYNGTSHLPAMSIVGQAENDWTTTSSTNNGAMIFQTISAGVNAEKMRITSTGKVGIGTTSPAYQFNVVNPTGGGTLAQFEGNPTGVNAEVAINILNLNTTAPMGSNLDMSSVNAGTLMPDGNVGQVSIRMMGNNYSGGYGNAGEAVLDASNFSTGLNISNRSSTGPIRFSKSSLEYMRITPTGDVGIGATVPTAKLHVAGTINFANPYAGAANAKIYTNGAYGQLEILNDTSNNDLAYLSLHSSNNVAWQHGMIGSTYVISQTAGAVKTYNDVERLSITNSGNIGIGILAPAQKLDVVGNIKTSGCLYYNASSLGTCASDERLKEDIRPFKLGLDEVLGINPVHFKYNGLGGLPKDNIEQLGVIAQDVEKSAPDLVVKKKVKLHPEDEFETEIKAVDYGAFTYALINATKELYGMVRELFENREEVSRELASIRAENEALKSYICQKDPEAPFCKRPSDQ